MTRTKSRIVLRPLAAADLREFVEAVRQSRKLHRPWTAPPSTPAEFRTYLKRMAPPANRAFLVCARDDGAIVGVFNVTHIIMARFCSAYLGYYAFAPHARRGLMREGLEALLRHAFGWMKLHRLEANIQPGNRASIALVKSCGFAKEGFSPKYLKIGGRWRDHERWAIIAR